MRAFHISAILFPVFLGATVPADALSAESLSDQDLAATVSGPFILVAFHASTKGNQTETMGDGGSPSGDFFGIETVSTDARPASVSQAATTLTIRAALTIRANRN